MAILAWVRFHGIDLNSKITSEATILPLHIIFLIFAVHFYRQLIAHKYERAKMGLSEAETMAIDLDIGRTGTTLSGSNPVINV